MINTTDLDSRNMQTAHGWVQGYNAQAAVDENQIVIAAEITVELSGLRAPRRHRRRRASGAREGRRR